MDPDAMRFRQEDELTERQAETWQRFGVGDELRFDGIRFRITELGEDSMVLRPVGITTAEVERLQEAERIQELKSSMDAESARVKSAELSDA